jgi:predicted nucleotidyltransferase component of viral defense system
MISPEYRAQVELLLRILPDVAKEESLALKGGTGINLFVRDMPRLSVDIDLTYLPIKPRADALKAIAEALHRIKGRLESTIPGITAQVVSQSGGQEAKVMCRLNNARVTIEVNTIIRGHLWPVRELPLVQSAQDEFRMFAAATVVSDAELFGGKICAALDRQHPRDIFDVQPLLDGEGLNDEIRQGFLASLLSHGRPMHELLRPKLQEQRVAFETQFSGMSIKPYSYEQFEATRERLVREIHARLTGEDRALLLSVKRGEPDWSLFPIEALRDMPAVQWKLANILKLKQDKPDKHREQLEALRQALSE